MIVSNLTNSPSIESLHPRFKRLFEYVKAHRATGFAPGRITLEGEELFINSVCRDAVAAEKQPLEVHRRYIDVHILLEGREKIGWKAADTLHLLTQPYSETDEAALYADAPTAWVDLLPGEFLIAYPADAHAPLIGEGKIHKLIGKVKI